MTSAHRADAVTAELHRIRDKLGILHTATISNFERVLSGKRKDRKLMIIFASSIVFCLSCLSIIP